MVHRWHNYIVEADIQLLAEAGDAGIVIRASQEEVGVDSYHGYFAGLRDLDDTLILGRADYGWHEFQAIPVQPGVHTATWYHLKFLAYECSFAASSTTANGEITTAILQDRHVFQRPIRLAILFHRRGVRNVVVRPASQSDLRAMLSARGPSADHPLPGRVSRILVGAKILRTHARELQATRRT